jgi:hypothetical protein
MRKRGTTYQYIVSFTFIHLTYRQIQVCTHKATSPTLRVALVQARQIVKNPLPISILVCLYQYNDASSQLMKQKVKGYKSHCFSKPCLSRLFLRSF